MQDLPHASHQRRMARHKLAHHGSAGCETGGIAGTPQILKLDVDRFERLRIQTYSHEVGGPRLFPFRERQIQFAAFSFIEMDDPCIPWARYALYCLRRKSPFSSRVCFGRRPSRADAC
jgi:hypothetical protein